MLKVLLVAKLLSCVKMSLILPMISTVLSKWLQVKCNVFILTSCYFHSTNFQGQQAHSTADDEKIRESEAFDGAENEMVASGVTGIRGMFSVYFPLATQYIKK